MYNVIVLVGDWIYLECVVSALKGRPQKVVAERG